MRTEIQPQGSQRHVDPKAAPLPRHRIAGGILSLCEKRRFAVAYAIMVLGLLALIPALDGYYVHGDVRLYQGVSEDLLSGRLPYRDRALEYPPYAIPFFLLPNVFGSDDYPGTFIYLALIADCLIKVLLLIMILRHTATLRSLLPLVCYCAAIPFLRFFILQRYDLWPALVCLLVVWLFCSGRYALAGTALAAGIGLKLYPLVFAPPLFLLAASRARGRQFLAGLAAGLLPIALLSLFLPWWRFAQFHGARGLQCESIYASLLWLAGHFGLPGVHWVRARAWLEVQGPLATALVPWAKAILLVATAASVALATWSVASLPQVSLPRLARVLLLPLLAFVAFNQVLSPQYMVWILPLAALTALEGELWTALLMAVATALTPIFFPSLFGDYGDGLNLFETVVLVLRNVILIAVWVGLAVSLARNLCPLREAALALRLSLSCSPTVGTPPQASPG